MSFFYKVSFLNQNWLLGKSVVPNSLWSIHGRRLVFINNLVVRSVIAYWWHTCLRLMDFVVLVPWDTSCKCCFLLWLTSILCLTLRRHHFGSFRAVCCHRFTVSLLPWVFKLLISHRVYFLVQIVLQNSSQLLTIMLRTNSCFVWSTSEIFITVGFLFGSFWLITAGAVCFIANFLFSSATKGWSLLPSVSFGCLTGLKTKKL